MSGNVGKCVGNCREMSGNVGTARGVGPKYGLACDTKGRGEGDNRILTTLPLLSNPNVSHPITHFN